VTLECSNSLKELKELSKSVIDKISVFATYAGSGIWMAWGLISGF
jgi:hypothetical protein